MSGVFYVVSFNLKDRFTGAEFTKISFAASDARLELFSENGRQIVFWPEDDEIWCWHSLNFSFFFGAG